MNEYRVQRLKEDLTFAQQRNKRQRQQLANYKKVHEKDLKEIEKLNNIINEFDKWLDEESEKTILSTGHLTCLMMCKNKLQELKGSDKE